MIFLDEPLSTEPKLLNPLTLAYMGDAVLEVYVRQHLIAKKGAKPHLLHRMATQYVSAKAQSRALHILQEELTEEESWMVKRGRNTKSGTIPKNADPIEYRNSSGFECMLGYLYLTGQKQRLDSLIKRMFTIIETGEKA
ncbi:Mini-ribonuclease 3 [Ammoniphilus sp. CFH 90114]|uniref:Mini-ribonuclease 3 n=1 Tax=Ammoniphilus sp. CFH 90114 TaxID=2493665 RepID=UPI00100F216A|nr:Mini-ribonuclease 3 [Ammoniphilus sp. CFH 90114]RXT09055.1 ribonuclease III [Ammoniphilus sp. CFH 90114]